MLIKNIKKNIDLIFFFHITKYKHNVRGVFNRSLQVIFQKKNSIKNKKIRFLFYF